MHVETRGPRNRCRVCGVPIDVHQRVRGQLCGADECRRVAVETDLTAKKREHIALVRERLRARLPALLPELDSASVADELIAVLPCNVASVAPRSLERAQAFRDHLASELSDVVQTMAAEQDAAAQRGEDGQSCGGDDGESARARPSLPGAAAMRGSFATEPLDALVERKLGQLCSVCRGSCCQRHGATTALLDAARLREVLEARGCSAEQLGAQYLSYLPAQSYDGGCVFQGESGCTLPREMRSHTCNSYQCGGLEAACAVVAEQPQATLVGVATLGIWPHLRFSAPSIERTVVIDGAGAQLVALQGEADDEAES